MFLFIQWMGVWIILTIFFSCWAKQIARRHRMKNREANKKENKTTPASDDEELLPFDTDATFL